MSLDVSKAHLNAVCEDDVYIVLLEECGTDGSCGKLNYWLYGFRKAAKAWKDHYANKLEEVGFQRGEAYRVAFYHPERDVSLAGHDDDFTFCGVGEELQWIKELMRKWFDIKDRGT